MSSEVICAPQTFFFSDYVTLCVCWDMYLFLLLYLSVKNIALYHHFDILLLFYGSCLTY